MARHPKPWRRKSRKGEWWAQVGKRQRFLAPADASETQALRALVRILGEPPKATEAEDDKPPLKYVLDRFLARSYEETKLRTYENYKRYLAQLDARHGHRPAEELTPDDVTRWAKSYGWKTSTQGAAIQVAKAATRWAAGASIIPKDPLASLRSPSPVFREEIPDASDVAALLAHTATKSVGPILAFIAATGCRIGEAVAVEARHVNLAKGVVVLPEHKTREQTNRPRVIVLSDEARAILAEAIDRHPDGKLFRNRNGKPWVITAVESGVRAARGKLGLGPHVIAHGLRHRFATDALKTSPNGVVAALLGHTSTAMVDRVYSKIHAEIATLIDAAGRARKV